MSAQEPQHSKYGFSKTVDLPYEVAQTHSHIHPQKDAPTAIHITRISITGTGITGLKVKNRTHYRTETDRITAPVETY